MGVGAVLTGIVQQSSERHTVIAAAGLHITADFLEGCQTGERIDFCVHADKVRAAPLNEGSGSGCVLELAAADEDVDRVHLLFAGGLMATVSRTSYQEAAGAKQWAFEFPSGSITLLGPSRS